jgi:hypothetical protein
MSERAAALAAALLLAGCAAAPAPPDSFSFAVMGDAPYNAAEEVAFEEMIARINADEDLAFALHVGDTKGGGPCTDALYERRRAQFDSIRHPLVYTPGDNEWLECRDAAGRSVALERLARLREVYFSRPESLGATRLPMQAQGRCLAPPVAGCGCGALPENRRWSKAGVTFVTLHVVGEDDNFGYDAARDAEARCRREGNLRWLDRATDAAIAEDARALVVVVQANPWLSTRAAHAPFLARLEASARRFARPVLLVHGDTHTYRVAWPFQGVTLVETYGSPFVGWVKVTVSPRESVPFRFDGRLVAMVPDPPREPR